MGSSQHDDALPAGQAHHSHHTHWDIAPGDEIERPRRKILGRLLSRSVALLTLAGACWLLVENPSIARMAWSKVSALVTPMIDRTLDGSTRDRATGETAQAPEEPGGTLSVAESSPFGGSGTDATATIRPAASTIPASVNPANGDDQTSAPPVMIAPAPPVHTVARTKPATANNKLSRRRTPLHRRAIRAGLHPDLSPALLKRLSKADFRNAKAAIRTALIKTADDATYVAPRRGKSARADFSVRFVPATTRGCRRYVVTIAMNRWVTTALPVEKCGIKRKRQAASARRS